MNTMSDLTIVIPAKNEAQLMWNLLTSLTLQDYEPMLSTKVYLADANSTDGTPEIGRSYSEWLDIELYDPTLIRRSIALMKQRSLHCLTTSIACPEGGLWDRWLYAGNNLVQHLSALYKPFSTGMFMLFDRAEFLRLGGFHERALYAEDYLLSQKVARSRFAILPGHVVTTNRRFKKMGHLNLVRLFLNTALHTHNESFFLRDHKYWHFEA